MLIHIIYHLFKSNIRNSFFYRFSIIFEIISIFSSLFIYYYTSKTFGQSVTSQLEKYQMDYFNYIVWGEVLISIPIFFIEGIFRTYRNAYLEGFWETIKLLRIRKGKILFFLVFSEVPREILRVILTITTAALFFGLNIKNTPFLEILFFITVSVPLFIAIGLIFTSIFIATKRGQGLLGTINTIFIFLAGGYFPISVLPSSVQSFASKTPYLLVLENCRLLLTNQGTDITQYLYNLLPWLILSPISVLFFQFVLDQVDGVKTHPGLRV